MKFQRNLAQNRDKNLHNMAYTEQSKADYVGQFSRNRHVSKINILFDIQIHLVQVALKLEKLELCLDLELMIDLITSIARLESWKERFPDDIEKLQALQNTQCKELIKISGDYKKFAVEVDRIIHL